jgi:hypothetical protein
MSDYSDYEKRLQSANRALYEKHQLILWKINRMEQLEHAVNATPFREIPRGGFPAEQIGETIWTRSRAAWERAHLGRIPEEVDALAKKADDFIAWLDEEQAKAARFYEQTREYHTRVFDDWRY